MTDIITPSDPLTWHDQRPTHPTRPDWLIQAKTDMDRAWKNLVELVDIMTEQGALDHDRLNDARRLAEAQQDYYFSLCDIYNSGHIPASIDFERLASEAGILSECGCVLPEQSCPACRQAAAMTYQDIF